MTSRPTNQMSRPTAFAAGTVRAFSAALLLLGLSGDRRVR